MNEFEQFADEAPVWIFGASRDLSVAEESAVTEAATKFLAAWKTHGKPVEGSARLIDRRFLVFGVSGESSGCSIDSLYDFVRSVEQYTGTTFLDPSRVFYRNAQGEIVSTDRPTFRDLAKKGEVTAATEVFNPAVATAGEARVKWRIPAGESWHSNYLT